MTSVRRFPVAVRRLLVRRPWIHWLVVGVATVAAMATTLARVDRIDAARAEWGATRTVWVASKAAAPGEQIQVVATDVPAAVVPPSALAADGSAELVARQHVSPGEIVTEVDVGRDGGGALALVPDGWLAVPVLESPASGAAVGTRVHVVSDGVVLADEAVVVGYHDDVTLVAVPASEAPMLPVATDGGSLALLMSP